jgi:mannitol/fructose-specific phosphotransferase system IIA component (Ntr-type)
MTLADFTRPGLIVLHLRGRDATSAIHELSLVLQREGCVADGLQFYNEALNREYLASTEMEAGMAIPHARLAGLLEPVFAFGRSDEPFPWSPRVAHPVCLVFLLATPASANGRYLPLIAGLARLASDAALVETIRGAADESGILTAFRQMALPELPADSPPAEDRPEPSGGAPAQPDGSLPKASSARWSCTAR